MVSRTIPVEPFDLVIFGGTGDLARRMVIPAVYKRFLAEQIPDEARLIGAARSELTDDAFRQMIRDAFDEFAPDLDRSRMDAFLERTSYVSIDARGDAGWAELKSKVRSDVISAYYFSVAPGLFGDLANGLQKHGILDKTSRVIVEKPFGRDLETAKALNAQLREVFDESQIYRIDHYLGKETVQNLMAVRFGNVLFEPLFNAHYVDHIQITVAETIGVEGRGSYYDKSGAMRDMVQNHLMQLVCLIAMEPPAKFEADAVRDEKLKVIRALQPVAPHHIVRGQYQGDDDHASYREDAENPSSKTESFIALRTSVDNWRWAGTPIYMRTGKRLRAKASEIAVFFKSPPHQVFSGEEEHQNVLSIRLQPNEGITMDVTIKEPGPGGMRLTTVPLDMTFAEAVPGEVPQAYERLIMDVIRGNQTLFMRGDEVEAAWAWTDPIIAGWERRGDVPKPYEPGRAGPDDARDMMTRDGRSWRMIADIRQDAAKAEAELAALRKAAE